MTDVETRRKHLYYLMNIELNYDALHDSRNPKTNPYQIDLGNGTIEDVSWVLG